ncbi:hypothetical protein SB748_28905 [Rhizobium sp. SIMBA_035]
MLLQKVDENYEELRKIGYEAREAGRKIRMKPSCADTDHEGPEFKDEPEVVVRKAVTR